MPPYARLALMSLFATALAGCQPTGSAPDAPPDATVAARPAASEAVDWRRCRFAGLGLPVEGKLFVVDGDQPSPGTEAGRESIRWVEVLVPGPVSLLLTAPDASVWALRVSPETQLLAVFASGTQPQRITGAGLGKTARIERSSALGDDCGRYWLASGEARSLPEATRAVFGRSHDAVYGLRSGRVVIGDGSTAPRSVPVTGTDAPKE